MAQFSKRMNTEVLQRFWAAIQQGMFITEAAQLAGTYREMGGRWLAADGGIRPHRGRDLKGRCLSFREREEIALHGRRGIDALDRRPAGSAPVDDQP